MKKILFILVVLFIPTLALSAQSLGSKLQGKILLAVEDKGKTYYVSNGNRYQITKETALPIFRKLALGISNENLNEIPLADVGIDPEIIPKVETKSEIVTPTVSETCDYSSYNSQIIYLSSELSKAENLIKQYKNSINEPVNPIGEAVETKKKLSANISNSPTTANGKTHSILQIFYFETTKKDFDDNDIKDANIIVSSDDNGYFSCGGNLPDEIINQKSNPITCPTYKSTLNGKPVADVYYFPNIGGERTITISANGTTITEKLYNNFMQCNGYNPADNIICN